MECRCDTVDELYGAEAEAYAAEHLRSAAGELVCPDTGARWAAADTADAAPELRKLPA